MLILSRRVGESIMIGKDITVTLVSVRGRHASVGVTAPREIAVNREEVHERIKLEGLGSSYADYRSRRT
jgi:carbon storage regulator